MARTKGAIDKRPRKRSNTPKRSSSQGPTLVATGNSGKSPAPEAPLPGVNPEFLNAIDSALGGSDKPQVSPGCEGSHEPSTPAVLEEAPLTREAWEGVLRVPFRVLALAVQAPGVADVGEKRAKDLARPSYRIFEHYAREYLAMNPDDPLSLAWAATGLVLADIAADVGVEIMRARAERQPPAAPELPGGQVVNQAA